MSSLSLQLDLDTITDLNINIASFLPQDTISSTELFVSGTLFHNHGQSLRILLNYIVPSRSSFLPVILRNTTIRNSILPTPDLSTSCICAQIIRRLQHPLNYTLKQTSLPIQITHLSYCIILCSSSYTKIDVSLSTTHVTHLTIQFSCHK